jgi:hypothetical protein
LTALVLTSAPSAEGAGADRPRVALSVSPARLALAAPGSRTIKVRNDGAERVVVDVARRTLGRQTAGKTWLQIVPSRLVLRSRESAALTIRVKPPQRAEPGDHPVLILLTTRALGGSRVNVRLRLGVRITMVVPYYPYARQDKKSRGREPISARLIADLYKAASQADQYAESSATVSIR